MPISSWSLSVLLLLSFISFCSVLGATKLDGNSEGHRSSRRAWLETFVEDWFIRRVASLFADLIGGRGFTSLLRAKNRHSLSSGFYDKNFFERDANEKNSITLNGETGDSKFNVIKNESPSSYDETWDSLTLSEFNDVQDDENDTFISNFKKTKNNFPSFHDSDETETKVNPPANLSSQNLISKNDMPFVFNEVNKDTSYKFDTVKSLTSLPKTSDDSLTSRLNVTSNFSTSNLNASAFFSNLGVNDSAIAASSSTATGDGQANFLAVANINVSSFIDVATHSATENVSIFFAVGYGTNLTTPSTLPTFAPGKRCSMADCALAAFVSFIAVFIFPFLCVCFYFCLDPDFQPGHRWVGTVTRTASRVEIPDDRCAVRCGECLKSRWCKASCAAVLAFVVAVIVWFLCAFTCGEVNKGTFGKVGLRGMPFY